MTFSRHSVAQLNIERPGRFQVLDISASSAQQRACTERRRRPDGSVFCHSKIDLENRWRNRKLTRQWCVPTADSETRGTA